MNELDLFPTILDYIVGTITTTKQQQNGQEKNNHSDGSSLCHFIEKQNYNKNYDDVHAVLEWNFHHPKKTENNDDQGCGGAIILTRKLDFQDQVL